MESGVRWYDLDLSAQDVALINEFDLLRQGAQLSAVGKRKGVMGVIALAQIGRC